MITQGSTNLERETATQPADWARVIGRLGQVRGVLPTPGQRVAIIGCGTSYHVALAYAAARESAGIGQTDAWPASQARLRDYDRVVLVSRSGTTTEVVDILDELTSAGIPVTSLVATAGTPLAERSPDLILLADVDESSVVQTRFATTVLALLLASLGHDLTGAIAEAEAVLAASEDEAVGHLLDAEQVTFLGQDLAYGLALEAGLKLRESAQAWTEAYHSMEYRHGPIAIAAPGRVVWSFGPLPEGLADQIARTGAHLETRPVHPLAELVRVHRLCAAQTRRRGLDPDSPRHLTRSIVLA